jgi:hypothetical protein
MCTFKLENFARPCREIAAKIEVKHKKGGLVFRAEYDIVAWSWATPGEKIAHLVAQMREVMEQEAVKQEEMQNLAGKIIHVGLIPVGKYNLRHIIRANNTVCQQTGNILCQSLQG